ncbi:UDP-2,4-diacetamido-2,4,6-trideoxy-beta-L-altropyranose hydrolase [Arcobacter vandammei]|uniref:UDP-2,4-diacetamido-2,4, 6-trideoxy-beta-L-altropyranose hydrolase n=1 Tax=Arcobacter vandammei TaxID=2782243 RepID=UPI0018DF0C15|nr:UDP-2,4-diacetamido-2,4,6-trideoxy-beta-L-altropyranose hydrolase [Arcobacter vandammei]
MNILIRADSSSIIGTGHIKRDLVLAKDLGNGTFSKRVQSTRAPSKNKIIFATQDLQGNINKEIKEAGYRVEILKSSDFEELNSLIKKLNIDMIVIDNYDIDYDFEKKLKEENPSLKIFVLDDTYEKHYCDILLNHNIYASEKKYKNLVPESCELRCGAKYTLLRDEFIEIKKSPITNHQLLTTVFLAMGGADNKNLNIKILKVLKQYKKNIKVNLVTTNANKNLEKLKEYCENKEWINLQINSRNIAKLMNQSNFAIITPSVTTNEAYFLDLPMIAIKTAKNQKEMYEYLAKNGYFALKKFDKKELEKYIKQLIKKFD